MPYFSFTGNGCEMKKMLSPNARENLVESQLPVLLRFMTSSFHFIESQLFPFHMVFVYASNLN